MEKREQLKLLIEHYTNGNKSQFAKMLGISAQGLSSWITRNTYDSEKLFANCRGLSAKWLLTGEGEMLLPSDHSPIISGDGNTQVVGNSNNVNGGDVLAKTLAEMKDLIQQQMESNSILVESNRMLVDSNKKLVDLLAEKCSS